MGEQDCGFDSNPQTENLHDALANLCQLFAATVGEDDVKLFKYHVKCDEPRKWTGTVVEIHVPAHINFKWNHSNLENSRELGYEAAKQAIQALSDKEPDINADKAKNNGEVSRVHFVNEDPQAYPGWQQVRKTYADLKERAVSGAKPK
jgi:hypothetical protein